MKPCGAPEHFPRSTGLIGLVGLGLMGSAMAERLLDGGFAVLGFDIASDRVTAARDKGVLPASGAPEIAARCRRIVFSLYDSASVRSVLDQMRDRLRAGQIIVDTTTGDVESVLEAGRQLSAMEVGYLDATISGNRDQLLRREVTIMAGGSRQAFDQCQDLFELFARQVLHVGDTGAGAKMKLVTNLVLGLNRAALAEGLVLAQSLGLKMSDALTVLTQSPAYSRAMDVKGLKMVEGDFTPQARLSQHLKDVRLILEAAARAGQRLPLSETHRELLELAEQLGFGSLDNSAILRAIESQKPLDPPQ